MILQWAKIGQSAKNGQFLRKVQVLKTEPGKLENTNRPITSIETETMIKNLPRASRPRWHHRWILLNLYGRSNIYTTQTVPLLSHDPPNVVILVFGSSASSKPSLQIWKFSVNIMLRPSLNDFDHNLASMWNEYNCTAPWMLFSIAIIWDSNKNWHFPILWPLLSLQNLLIYWVQHFNSIIF